MQAGELFSDGFADQHAGVASPHRHDASNNFPEPFESAFADSNGSGRSCGALVGEVQPRRRAITAKPNNCDISVLLCKFVPTS
jgi:hypothetical protein